FKTTKSLFPSGYINLEKLKKNLVKTVNGNSDKYYKWNKIYFAEEELKPLFAAHLSKYVIENATNERLKVVETNTKTLQTYNEKYNTYQKLNVNEVHADAYDLGFAMALSDTYLRAEPSEKAMIKTTIPLGTPIEVEIYDKKFAQVKYQSYTGYVDLSEIITKFDLATFVYANNQWHQIKKREFDKIITKNGSEISLNSVKGIITPPHIGIIASNSQKIPLWSKVEISEKNLPTWQESKLPEQGLVWWKPNKDIDEVYYSIDDILKKEISYVSFHPRAAYKGIVSANGVYITQNGSHWKRLQQFENYNGPVHYLNDLIIFVGNFRSLDGGATFENYIQIDKLASAIEDQYGFTPKNLQVKKIESSGATKIKIEVDTGNRKLNLESPLFSQNWRAVKS
ncbi:MAG: hypothetical protein ACXWPX_10220, partial [Pseudobdellovibrio sp.]